MVLSMLLRRLMVSFVEDRSTMVGQLFGRPGGGCLFLFSTIAWAIR
jgi:hypothetical protein